MRLPAALPSPESAAWWLGPVPLRAYSVAILLGIVVAIVMTRYRLRARGGTGEEIYDVAPWVRTSGAGGTDTPWSTSPTRWPPDCSSRR